MPLQLLPEQIKVNEGNEMRSTRKRLVKYGGTVVGYCREGFLIPEHNKAGCETRRRLELSPKKVATNTHAVTGSPLLRTDEAKAFEPSLYARTNDRASRGPALQGQRAPVRQRFIHSTSDAHCWVWCFSSHMTHPRLARSKKYLSDVLEPEFAAAL
eukprot:2279709-Prymnesium_polylepis.1